MNSFTRYFVKKSFRFFSSFTGRSIFYIFFGLLILSKGTYLDIVCGFLVSFIGFGIFLSSMKSYLDMINNHNKKYSRKLVSEYYLKVFDYFIFCIRFHNIIFFYIILVYPFRFFLCFSLDFYFLFFMFYFYFILVYLHYFIFCNFPSIKFTNYDS